MRYADRAAECRADAKKLRRMAKFVKAAGWVFAIVGVGFFALGVASVVSGEPAALVPVFMSFGIVLSAWSMYRASAGLLDSADGFEKTADRWDSLGAFWMRSGLDS